MLRNGRFGPYYACSTWPDCDVTQRATPDGTPVGAPSDRATRIARIQAHKAFDKLWLSPGPLKRKEAYIWLSTELGMTLDECHIGLFDAQLCAKVVQLCATKLGG